MAIGIILGIILVLGFIGAFIFMGITIYQDYQSCYRRANEWSYAEKVKDFKLSKKAIMLCITGILLFISFLIVPFSFHTVEAGEVAVVKHLGKAEGVKTAGTYWDFWMIKSYDTYDAKVQNVDITTMAYSSDAQTMDVQMVLQYSIMTDHVIDIATQYGSLTALEGRIQSIAIEKAKSVLSSYKAMDIIADRASMSPSVEEAIKGAIGDEYFVNVTTVVLTNIDFSDAFELAVEEKMIAEQAKLKAEYENETKIAQAKADAEAKLKAAQAEIEIAQAKADAELKAAQAQAEIAKAKAEAKLKEAEAQIEIEKAKAESLKIQAEAEAEANKIITESITQDLIDKILADNWNGELPDVIGNGEFILPPEIIN